ncbi:MAG: hypothetical protein UT29_C0001G0148 [Candidatus Yanofskybacteria bacterium GW2011_GWA1_39_13]|uniref:Uncharacterized protein n=1 Tax=Yanofskybacteria sp. (strain GW2011_GWA1_39_13) TaxID=1619019 RepID=A0A0G0MHQ1_YANXG|nr:MAG: hypothetical protein UT29_C0001G0148 [Candidatus Yanofskybacteria bacterium GW2011_GWA1_39_13]
MRSEYIVHCTYETQHQFSDGLGIITYDAVIIVRTKNQDQVEPLLNKWGGKINIKIREIKCNGIIEGDEDDVAKTHDNIISVRPAAD